MRRLRIISRLPFVRGNALSRRLLKVSERTYPRIIVVMEERRPFLKHEFSMSDLCELVGSNRTYVSSTLKLHGTSFPTLVNSFRCRYIAELLDEGKLPDDLEDVAVIAGFPSKRAMISNLKRFAPDVYIRVRQIVKNNF